MAQGLSGMKRLRTQEHLAYDIRCLCLQIHPCSRFTVPYTGVLLVDFHSSRTKKIGGVCGNLPLDARKMEQAVRTTSCAAGKDGGPTISQPTHNNTLHHRRLLLLFNHANNPGFKVSIQVLTVLGPRTRTTV